MSHGWLRPSWPVPAGVRAVCTLRQGGVSAPPFASLNLALHVGDEPEAVAENRRRVRTALNLPAEPLWLEQVHGAQVADADAADVSGPADGAVTTRAGCVLAILIADCMPVLLASEDGRVLACAHAGWRGLAAGVLEATVRAMRVEPPRIHAWLGPAIGTDHFEVGAEVRDEFLAQDPRAGAAFTSNARGRWQCDLQNLARQRLAALGLHRVSSANVCTYAQAEACFSYRRDGRTGRMAALIWR